MRKREGTSEEDFRGWKRRRRRRGERGGWGWGGDAAEIHAAL